MIKAISTLIIFLLFCLLNIQAQEKSFEEKVQLLSNQIEKITTEERSVLKNEIKEINKRLKMTEISETEAQQLKKKAAAKSAQNIQNRVSAIEKQLLGLVQNKVDNEIFQEDNRRRFSIGNYDINYTKEFKKYKRIDRRTKSNTVFAFGLNNLVTDKAFGSIDNEEFELWNSRFFEWGINYKTRVFKEHSHLYVDYGFSVLYNTLRVKQNKYFVVDGNTTVMQTHAIDLKKSKFKNVQLVFPMYLELDFSKPKVDDENGKKRYRTNRGVRIGVGGFVGVNLKTKQILKYKQDGKRTRDVQKGDFKVNNFVYGLSAFIGHKDTSFYVKYNLNELFKNASSEQNNISFGVRFDW